MAEGTLISEPLQGLVKNRNFFTPGLPKLNPGLEVANTFGVGFCFCRPWDAAVLRNVICEICGCYF